MMRRRADDEVVFAAALFAPGDEKIETVNSRDHVLSKPLLRLRGLLAW